MTDQRVLDLLDRALDYRGFVTLRRRDGASLVGFVYDRSPHHVEVFDERATDRIKLAIDDIADVALTGEDTAAKAQKIWERRRGSLEPKDTSRWGGWESGPTLIVVALERELRAIARSLGTKLRRTAVTGRLGERRAVALAIGMGGSAGEAIAAERPEVVIACGYSGALDPWLRAGDLVLASSVTDDRGGSLAPPELALHAARRAFDGWPRVSEGEITCTARVAATRPEKRALARRGRLAVDLESFAIARAAHDAGIPWLILRVILDPIDSDLPAFTRQARASYLLPALRHALAGSRGMIEVARLGVHERIANRSLERALGRLAPVIGGLHPAEVAR